MVIFIRKNFYVIMIFKKKNWIKVYIILYNLYGNVLEIFWGVIYSYYNLRVIFFVRELLCFKEFFSGFYFRVNNKIIVDFGLIVVFYYK